jgi:acyl-CoA synthetase (NDP forming)
VPANLNRLYRPRSVALVGASSRPDSLPAKTLANLIGSSFRGKVFPVNPRYTELAGLRCYASLSDIPDQVDLALILVAAGHTKAVVEECARLRVGAAVLFAAGFAELGEEGRDAQADLARAARAGGVRLLGPNCQGLLYQPSGVVATFSAAVEQGLGEASGVAYIGQSGAIGGSFLSLARERGVGVTGWFSLGNQADLTVTELATDLVEDAEIEVVALHLESLPGGSEWVTLTGRARQLGKQLVLLRPGESEAGRRAAASHTGAMIGPDAAFNLVCESEAVIAVGDVDELVDTVALLVTDRRPTGPGVGIVTSSGGAGALAADHLAAVGLTVPSLANASRERIAASIPVYGSANNPVDVTAQLFTEQNGAFGAVCRTVSDDRAVGAVLIVLTNVVGQTAVHVAESIRDAAAASDKPFQVAWLVAVEPTRAAREVLRSAGIVVYRSVRQAAANIARLQPAPAFPPARNGASPDRSGRLDEVLPAGGRSLTEWEGAALLGRLGIPHPDQRLAASAREAAAAARALGTEVVLKIQSPDISHKSEVGGVRLGVAPTEAGRAYRDLRADVARAVPGVRPDGVLVQAQAKPGLELILAAEGSHRGYPPVLTVGLGGIATELFADVASALAPLDRDEALRLLRRLKGWPLLAGHRGRDGVDVDSVVTAIVSVADAAVELGDRLGELEINPLIAYPQGVLAVDLLVRLTH